MTSRMILAGLLAGALAISATVVAAGIPANATVVVCRDDVPVDFDGDGADVVIGLPSYDLPGKRNAGAIVVFSNVAASGDADPRLPTKTTLLTADDFDGLHAQTDAQFGSAVVVWGDAGVVDDPGNCADLFVSAPGQSVDGKKAAGQVYRLKGTEEGWGPVLDVLDEASLPGTGGAQAGARFGAAVALSTFQSVVVGAPGRDIGEAENAGRIVRLDYPTLEGDPVVAVIEQGDGAPGHAETGDRFGQVLRLWATGDGPVLGIGVPKEDVAGAKNAGVVTMLTPDGVNSTVSQKSPGAAGRAEKGDQYGASLTGWFTFEDTPEHTGPVGVLAIGVPGEDVAGVRNAGVVAHASYDFEVGPGIGFEPMTGSALIRNEDSRGVPGTVEPGDRYGSAVAAADFGAEGQFSLVATAPNENLGPTNNAGLVATTAIELTGSTSPGAQPGAWTQNSKKVAGKAERGDRFGARVSEVWLTEYEDDDDSIWAVLLVTTPGEDVGNVADAGIAYLGVAGHRSVPLRIPDVQAGAGLGMVPMERSV